MADLEIRKEFIEGVNEVFTTLFNNGSENTDGVFLYLLSENNTSNIYGEQKYKVYQSPKLLVCKAVLNPILPERPIEETKSKAEFTVPLKSLHGNNLSENDLERMRKGIMKFHNTFYIIDNIIPKAFVEDVFLLYSFLCTEDIHTTSVTVED